MIFPTALYPEVKMSAGRKRYVRGDVSIAMEGILFQLRIMNGAGLAGLRPGAGRIAALTAGGLAGVRVQDHVQPLDRLFIIFAPAAYIADPRGKMRDRDEFISEPRKISQQARPHDARMAFVTGHGLRRKVLRFLHIVLNAL
jgi:hypothetical protein